MDEFLIDAETAESRLSNIYNKFLDVPARKVSESFNFRNDISYFLD